MRGAVPLHPLPLQKELRTRIFALAFKGYHTVTSDVKAWKPLHATELVH